ncbi:MAG TPA: hypothetical protein VGN78_15550 [Solirubrobacteraceae bacterium]|jgi:hypothetical protein|nr:hypothetical protein [Solirubrobacteraceae bacterium]
MPIHRLRVLLNRRSLDARLAQGESPGNDAELALRAAQLCAPRTRRYLAIGLERVLTDDGGPSWSAAAPVDRRAVDDARPYLAQLAAMLRSAEPVAPQGVARALRLLTEVPSPLYAPAEPSDLRHEAGLALFWLDPAPREPLPAAAAAAT